MANTLLLDLGNVVLGIDFKRVFRHWAASAKVDEQRFYDRWTLDAAYDQHEVGAISFSTYCQHLAHLFDVELTDQQWRAGWNDLFTHAFESVLRDLDELASNYEIYAFTNTNNTHAHAWKAIYEEELKRFQHVFISSEIGLRKPDPNSYTYICKYIGVRPGDVIFIDDREDNVEGARSAGLIGVHAVGEEEVSNYLRTLL